MIYDSIGSMSKYFTNQSAWKEVIDFLAGVDASLQVGRYEIAPGIHAIVDSYSTKSAVGVKMEKHHLYTDFQCLLRGEELIGFQPDDDSLEEVSPVSEVGDIGFFEPTHYDTLYLKPGLFTLFYAGEYHMPQLQVVEGKSADVIKMVIKIQSDLLVPIQCS
jgi:YhcH/YjgK/YiaL family protein